MRYIEGPKNIVADALSRLGLKKNPDFKDMLEQSNFYEHQVMAVQDHVPIKTMPIDLEQIKEHQDAKKNLYKLLTKDKRYYTKKFHEGEILGITGTEIELLCCNDRTVIPKSLGQNILE